MNTIPAALESSVLNHSQAASWRDAVLEWEVVHLDEDPDSQSHCVCLNEGLRYLYTIRNNSTDSQLGPIGSVCINHFAREDMNAQVDFLRRVYGLAKLPWEKRSFEDAKELEILSRDFIKAMYDAGFFEANKFNKNVPREDFDFYLSTFNNKSRTDKQMGKANAMTYSLHRKAVAYVRERGGK